jgi:F-type H+-transporting ATPase subunit b
VRKVTRWLWLSIWFQFLAEGNLWASGGGGGFSGELIWQVIAFVLVAFLLVKMMKKPMAAFLTKRRLEIGSSLDQASQKEAEAMKLLGDCEKKIESLSQEIKDLHETIRQEGEEERKKIIERAREEAERVRKQGQIIAEHEVKKARMALKKQVEKIEGRSGQAQRASDALADRFSPGGGVERTKEDTPQFFVLLEKFGQPVQVLSQKFVTLLPPPDLQQGLGVFSGNG